MAKSKVLTVRAEEVGKADVNGPGNAPSPVFRSVKAIAQQKLTDAPFPGVETCYDLTQRATREYSARPALGTRRLLEIKTVEGVRFPTKVYGETDWLSYAEVSEQAHNFGSGLRSLGVEPLHIGANDSLNDVTGNHTILMYEDTCAEWFIAAQGAHTQSIVVGTAYATLGVDSVISAVNEAGISTIFCNYNAVKAVLAKKDQMPSLKNVIYTLYNIPPQTRAAHPGKDDTITVLSFEEMIALGKEKAIAPSAPKGSDVCYKAKGGGEGKWEWECEHRYEKMSQTGCDPHVHLGVDR